MAGAMDELRTKVTNPFGLDNMHRESVLFLFPVDFVCCWLLGLIELWM